MHDIPLDSLPVAGALDRDATADGVVFRRLPAWTRPQIVDPALAVVVTMPAGVRIEMRTAATMLELDTMLTAIRIGDGPTTTPTFDLVVDGEVRSSVTATDFQTIVVDPTTRAFSVVADSFADLALRMVGARQS